MWHETSHYSSKQLHVEFEAFDVYICDRPRGNVKQVGKINFKIWAPTALTANFINFFSLGC